MLPVGRVLPVVGPTVPGVLNEVLLLQRRKKNTDHSTKVLKYLKSTTHFALDSVPLCNGQKVVFSFSAPSYPIRMKFVALIIRGGLKTTSEVCIIRGGLKTKSEVCSTHKRGPKTKTTFLSMQSGPRLPHSFQPAPQIARPAD